MDWIASGLSLVGTVLLAHHRMTAMYVYLASCLAFMVWAISIKSWAVLGLQVVLICLNIRTIITWRKKNGI